MPPIILVDSNFIANRAKHSMPDMVTNEFATGIIYGFMKDILRIANRYNSGRLVFCWDSRINLRKKTYPGYKAGRPKKDRKTERLAFLQFESLRRFILPEMGFKNVFMQRGMEGEDLIAMIIKSSKKKRRYVIVTSDHDLYQLLGPNVRIWNPQSKREITEESFKAEHNGMSPKKYAMLLAIAGCSTDKIKGIPDVGVGSALAYLTGGSISARRLDLIRNNKKLIEHELKYVELPHAECHGPIGLKKNRFDAKGFKAICKEYGLKSLLHDFYQWKLLTMRIGNELGGTKLS